MKSTKRRIWITFSNALNGRNQKFKANEIERSKSIFLIQKFLSAFYWKEYTEKRKKINLTAKRKNGKKWFAMKMPKNIVDVTCGTVSPSSGNIFHSSLKKGYETIKKIVCLVTAILSITKKNHNFPSFDFHRLWKIQKNLRQIFTSKIFLSKFQIQLLVVPQYVYFMCCEIISSYPWTMENTQKTFLRW